MKKLLILLLFIPCLLSAQITTNTYFAPAGSASTLLDGLLGYWAFEETSGLTCFDATDNDYDGSIDGTTTINQTGKVNQCYSYSTGSQVDLGNTAGVKPTGAMSISCWYKQFAYGGGMMGTYSGGDGFGLFTKTSTGYAQFQLYSNWSTASVISTTSVTTGSPTVWYHVVATWDGTTMKLYINNVQEGGDVAFAPDITYNADNVFLGNAPTLGGRCSENLDEVCIANRAWTTAEIAELWNDGNGRTHPFNQ